ncbi:MAG: ABC transporter permease subunit [Deltaproteobacteria bacterium]|nr:ABC transporter permease subunit [Deltaproteobacteria bacterium]
MSNIISITKKEFRSYFNSPIAYIFIITFLVITSWLFFRPFFVVDQASMRPFFSLLPWVFLFFIPSITMRLWAEEKKLGTIELLMTWPITDLEAVLGKFFASFAFLAITILLTFPIPITVSLLGNADIGPIIGGYVGTFFLGAAYLSIGLFISSLTENQIIAFILSTILIFLLFIIGEEFVLVTIPTRLAPIFSFLGLGYHFDNICRGVLDSRDLFYYLSVIIFFLFLNIRSLESRKWK